MIRHVMNNSVKILILTFLTIFFFTICKDDKEITDDENADETWDIEEKGIPQFVDVNYIELDNMYQISKFRSGIGHSYWDDFESCRSLKHYFQPKADADWSAIRIYSPVEGTVIRVTGEWAGAQVQIKSTKYPAFFFIIFHINLTAPLNVDDQVDAGQQIGTHIGSQTMSDIAVGVTTPDGWKLISYFEVMSNSLFQSYQVRGISSRDELIISKELRDAHPLVCEGDVFVDPGTLENWVVLN